MEIIERLNKALSKIDSYIGYATIEQGTPKVIIASERFSYTNYNARIGVLKSLLKENGVNDIDLYNINYFVMSEKEYREAVSSPAFNGI